VNPKATCHITRQASINARAFHNHSCKKLLEMTVKNDASDGVED